MVFKICPDDKHRCSRNSCFIRDDLGSTRLCKRHKKPLGFYGLRVLKSDLSRRNC